MNFSKFDVVLLFTMSLAVVLMSFAFPALGMTNTDAANESDIPEFNISTDRFDLVGDLPNAPGTPQQGTLTYDQRDGGSIEGVTQTWLKRSDSGENVVIEIFNASAPDVMEISYLRFDDTGAVVAEDSYYYNASDVGETIRHNNDSWVIDFEIVSLEHANLPNMTSEVDYQIQSSPTSGGGGLAGIPVIGGLFAAGEQLASMLGYAVSVLFWGVSWLFEVSANLLFILADTFLFAVGLLQWLVGTYTGLVASAPGWARVFVAVPGLLLFAEFGKVAMIAISLLPTT